MYRTVEITQQVSTARFATTAFMAIQTRTDASHVPVQELTKDFQALALYVQMKIPFAGVNQV